MDTLGKPHMFTPEMFAKLVPASGIAVIGTGVYALSKIVEEVLDIPGDIVECGTYLGGSAIAMAITAPEKKVWCFDTFAGMPEVTEHDQHKKGDFMTTYEAVKENTKPYPNITLVQGDFKDTIHQMMRPVALLYLDCDLYESYCRTLQHFWPLVAEGGWVVCEDYDHASCLGAKKACDEFFKPGQLQVRHDFWTVIK